MPWPCCLRQLADINPSAAEDMWHVFNLVRAGDKVQAVTFRKVAVHNAGGSESERVKIKLTISVEAVDFDPEGNEYHIFPLDSYQSSLYYNTQSP